jgi:hypothetical protein
VHLDRAETAFGDRDSGCNEERESESQIDRDAADARLGNVVHAPFPGFVEHSDVRCELSNHRRNEQRRDGLWDDIMGLRPRFKLISQIVVTLLLMLYGPDFRIQGTPDPFRHGQWLDFAPLVGVAISLLWYLGMMNAINFVDGLDGLLSGLTAISGTFLFAIAMTKGHTVVAIVLSALVGAVVGFLPYNFNPAKIILGDSGALFIGFIFAAAAVVGDAKSYERGREPCAIPGELDRGSLSLCVPTPYIVCGGRRPRPDMAHS